MTVYILLETILDEMRYEGGADGESNILGVYKSKEDAQNKLKRHIGTRKYFLEKNPNTLLEESEEYEEEKVSNNDEYSIVWDVEGFGSDWDVEHYKLQIIEKEVL